jgi:hypothetical protein
VPCIQWVGMLMILVIGIGCTDMALADDTEVICLSPGTFTSILQQSNYANCTTLVLDRMIATFWCSIIDLFVGV